MAQCTMQSTTERDAFLQRKRVAEADFRRRDLRSSIGFLFPRERPLPHAARRQQCCLGRRTIFPRGAEYMPTVTNTATMPTNVVRRWKARASSEIRTTATRNSTSAAKIVPVRRCNRRQSQSGTREQQGPHRVTGTAGCALHHSSHGGSGVLPRLSGCQLRSMHWAIL
jgi:hypothetical protein